MRRKSLTLILATATLLVGVFNQAAQAAPPAGPSFTNLTWTLGAIIPTAHNEAAGSVVGSKYYVISGADKSCSDTGQGTVTTAVDIYDTVTNTFTPGPSVNIGRNEYPMAATVGNAVYLIGGTSACFGSTVVQVEKLDLNTNTWSVLSSGSNLPAPLDGAEHCGTAQGTKIYYFESAGVGVFDTTTGTWTVLGPYPLLSPSDYCRATTLGSQIVITGPGNGTADFNSQRILVFDTNTGNVTLLPATTVPLAEHGAALLFGSVVVAGGDFALNSVQAISNPTCAACISATSTVSTFTSLPTDTDDGVSGAIGNVFYILGGNAAGNNNPPVLIGTP